MDGLRYLGCEEYVGLDFGYGTLFKTAGGIAEGAIVAHEQDVAQEKLDKDEETRVSAAVAADIAASNAQARAEISAQLKSPSASIDAQAAQLSASAQDKAGGALSDAGSQKRAVAADKALADAIKNAQAAPKDGYKAALVKAWTAASNKAHNTSIVSSDAGGGKGKGKGGKGSGESFWTRRVVGPLPGAAVVPIGVGVVGALGYAVKRIFFK